MPIRDRDLVDIWRNPKDPRWDQAHEEIRQLFFKHAKKAEKIRRVPKPHQEELLSELFSEFWCHVSRSPAVLQARAVKGRGAIVTEILRFAAGYRGPEVEASEEHQLRAHLHSKVREVLRESARFEQTERGNWRSSWFLAGGKPGRCLADHLFISRLPALRANLKPQRSGQLPPVADKKDLETFLEACLQLSGYPRSSASLAALAWDRLEPSPSPAERREIPDDDQLRGELRPALTPSLIARLEIKAARIADDLSARSREVVKLHYGGDSSIRDVAKHLRVSHETARADIAEFQRLLDQAIANLELERSRAEDFLWVVLDKIGVGSLPKG